MENTSMECKPEKKEQTPLILSELTLKRVCDLIQQKSSTKRKRNQDDAIISHCKSEHCSEIVEDEEILPEVPSTVLLEMRESFLRQDWQSMKLLFPYLLEIDKIEPVIWRYMLILLLYDPSSTSENFREFLEMCIGFKNPDDEEALKSLLTLHTDETE